MKLIKLLLIAVVIIGSIVGLTYYLNPDPDPDSNPDFSSEQANKWKQKIDNLCKEENWSKPEYEKISSGIRTDNATDENLLSRDEAKSLQKYLYATSCSYVRKGADHLFQQNLYPADKVAHYENTANFLRSRIPEMGSNSNLVVTLNLYAAYHQLLALLSCETKRAVWSHPLRPFGGNSATSRKSRIIGMSYYKSYFSKNSSIRNKVSRLNSDNDNEERHYYMDLELCIERHYESTKDVNTLLEDEMRFMQISTNPEAIHKLKRFVDQ